MLSDENLESPHRDPDRLFAEFRRKVRHSELLSAATVRLLNTLGFTGRLNVVLQNGRVLKSGYEEGYFHHRNKAAGSP
jgi:hypothetical protein